jgi:EPS-associated MarR family transcriptional regulator
MLEHYLKTLKLLSQHSEISQRELSRGLGVSLGKVNYLLKTLIDKGLVKTQRIKNSKNRIAYRYILTPAGIKKKTELTQEFLKEKIQEYEKLKFEIKELKKDLKEYNK